MLLCMGVVRAKCFNVIEYYKTIMLGYSGLLGLCAVWF